MKNFFKSALFIGILILIVLLITPIFEPKNNIIDKKRKDDLANGIWAEEHNTIDMLVVGDSESYTSYIPLEIWNQYGYTSYVCGTPAQGLQATASYIYDVSKMQKLKVVLLEANNLYRSVSLSKIASEIAGHVFPILKNHDMWKELNWKDLYEKPVYTNTQLNKGFYYSSKIRSTYNEEYMKKVEEYKKVRKINTIYMELINKYCVSNGIKLILYSAPSLKNWNYEKHNGIQKLADELGVDYIDLNTKKKELKINWKKDTRDKGDHLNYNGALKTTEYLGKWLANKNILKDHRNEEKYESWNEAYKEYKEKISNE